MAIGSLLKPGATLVRSHVCASSPSERKELLAAHVQPRPHVQVIESIPTHGEGLFAFICTHDREGIVAKRLDAPCWAGRQPAWVKIKNKDYARQEAVSFQS